MIGLFTHTVNPVHIGGVVPSIFQIRISVSKYIMPNWMIFSNQVTMLHSIKTHGSESRGQGGSTYLAEASQRTHVSILQEQTSLK